MNQHSVINEKMNPIAGKPSAVADVLKTLTLPPPTKNANIQIVRKLNNFSDSLCGFLRFRSLTGIHDALCLMATLITLPSIAGRLLETCVCYELAATRWR